MALAFVFPGQGSQAPGMGRDLAAAFPAAREVFQEVDEALKQKLSTLMFEGPAEELTLTANAQPALMAHSLAVLRVLEEEGGFDLATRVALVAGHSLGEYSALTAARRLRPADRRAAAAPARRGDAAGDAARDRRHGRAARRRARPRRRRSAPRPRPTPRPASPRSWRSPTTMAAARW